ncbi:MAG: DNA-binding protein [Ruminococcaceae bacterium]|nr:DNA-binding protein [Oscillospiraceae bacterium]
MKTDPAQMALLFDFYGELLTEKQRVLFDLYYNQDFSLGEIAENEGISRQGVHDAIARAEQALRNYEEKTGCVARHRRTQEAVAAIAEAAEGLTSSAAPDAKTAAQIILAAIDSIKE